ncbi:hypothetical protein PLESTB_000483200 [Pleodorina starrii]|uniref:Uncharacterized protein n=1 Tax=Pleodorina starrii TaxID=330485 RepID=A0A9W6BFT6_9CHLO|nr:hypothetical protein PLESTB_000483200 [Pleodorina starrii]GLC63618.1 hypothetical protein PLESTF_000056100 [Pleodorina starrii]
MMLMKMKPRGGGGRCRACRHAGPRRSLVTRPLAHQSWRPIVWDVTGGGGVQERCVADWGAGWLGLLGHRVAVPGAKQRWTCEGGKALAPTEQPQNGSGGGLQAAAVVGVGGRCAAGLWL